MSTRVLRALRGATSVAADDPASIEAATETLLAAMLERNEVAAEDLVSLIFTATPDLTADFPAHAARIIGWTDVPLLGATEVDVPGALPRVVRVLLTVEGAPRGRAPRSRRGASCRCRSTRRLAAALARRGR